MSIAIAKKRRLKKLKNARQRARRRKKFLRSHPIIWTRLKKIKRIRIAIQRAPFEFSSISGIKYFRSSIREKSQENNLFFIDQNSEAKIFNELKEKKEIKKEIRTLKKELNTDSLLDTRFFKPWRYEIPFLTAKQSWLQNHYYTFKALSLRDRTDFFQTHIGQTMLALSFSFPIDALCNRFDYDTLPITKLANFIARASMRSFFVLIRGARYLPDYKKFVSRKKNYFNLRFKNEKSWFYESTLRRPNSILFAKFKLMKFETAFHSNYRQISKRPWMEPLFFKRTALSAVEERYRKINKFDSEKLQYKFYLRNKNPRHIKRNRLYKRKIKLLANPWKRRRIAANKSARIKQIIGKLLRPFYGHLTLKQWKIIVKKNKKKKVKYQTRTETILQRLENRLDVTVYRLNWAPSVMWARRLIFGGFIFITNQKKMNIWNEMYSCFKKYSFPLKLRDPKNLYRKMLWYPNKLLNKQKFFYIPQKKISYLVQPGDMLQCSRAILMNQFKSNLLLSDKPISSRFLLGERRSKREWRWDRHQILERFSKDFDSSTEHIKSAIVLSKAKIKNLPKGDRSHKFFLRWVIS